MVEKRQCPKCNSKDNLVIWEDGHGKCFTPGCGYSIRTSGKPKVMPSVDPNSLRLIQQERQITPIASRGINTETCRMFGMYNYKDKYCAAYFNKDNEEVAFKVRDKSAKIFHWKGDSKSAGLFGQQLWRGGKRLVITEGEFDALAVSQVLGNKWPVVSLKNGAAGAVQQIKDQLTYLDSFEMILLCFDNDDAGRLAAKQSAAIIHPGKAYIMRIPNAKDANEALMNNCRQDIINAYWNAQPYSPDGIVGVADVIEKALKEPEYGDAWFLPTLTKLTYGRKVPGIYMLGAGTGVGKTDFLTSQMAFDIFTLGEPIAVFSMEQDPSDTILRVAGKKDKKLYHIPDTVRDMNKLRESLSNLDGLMYLYDNFGVADWNVIKNHMRHLRYSKGITKFYLDHLTALADPSKERESIETIMGELGGFVKEIGIMVHVVSHLATPDGKPHEEGGRVFIRHFKGSRSIGFWSHFMFGLERDTQAEDTEERSVTTLRVLKDRLTGRSTGATLSLVYDVATGDITEQPFIVKNVENNTNEVPF